MSRPGLIKLRSTPAYATGAAISNINVDRDALVITNAVVMMADVEAIGHGMMSDMTTLNQTADLGNAARRGVQGKLGHTGLSENGSGRQLHVARNFHIAGKQLLADLHLLEPARRSPAFGHDAVEWIMDMAEEHPEQIALSCVLGVKKVWVLEHGDEIDAEQMRERPETATSDLPIMRVESIWGVDAVTEGALTHDGLFAVQQMFDGTASEYAEEAFDFVDRWREEYNIPLEEVPRKVEQVLARYLYTRGQEERDMPSNTGKAKGGAGTSRRKQLDVSSGPTPGSVAPEEEGDELLDGALADDGSSEPDEPTANADTENSDDGDEVDAALDDALTDDDGADSEAEGEAPAADAVMAAKFDALENLVLKLSTRTEKLTALALKQQDTIRDLRQQVRRIDGEPVVTSNVSNRSSSFARRTSAPQPPSSVRKQTPGSISGAKVADAHNFDDDPETATLMMALARQKASIQTN